MRPRPVLIYGNGGVADLCSNRPRRNASGLPGEEPGRMWRERSELRIWLRGLCVWVVASVFGWGFEREREAVIVEGGIVVLVERYVKSGSVPFGKVIYPFRAGAVLRGDGFFARRLAEIFERVWSGVHEHGNFDELAAVENEISGLAVSFGMIEIGGNGSGHFSALGVVDGGEKMSASGAAGIFAADFHFVAGLAFKAQEDFDGLSDVMAVDFDGRWRCRRRRGLLREEQTGKRSGEGRKECDKFEGNDSLRHFTDVHTDRV
jgi:hypothetical protein